MHTPQLILIAGVLLVSVSLTAPLAAQSSAPYWPTEGWRTSTPEEQGIDSVALAVLMKLFGQGGTSSIHSLVVIRHGYIVLDASTDPFRSDQKHELYSATKSFISTLVGIAIDKGFIKGVDQSMWDFFSKEGVANMDAHKEAIQLKHLLSMTSGLGYTGLSTANDPLYNLTEKDQSWVSWMLDQPMMWEPGSNWFYTDGQAQLVSAIIQKATGKTALEFAQENLFGPLGISDMAWVADPQGVSRGGSDLFLSPHDMAKLGYLFLHNGEWDSHQIVSKAWVDAATSLQWKNPSYSYFWWLQNNPVRYAAMGYGGQLIYVLPQQDIVLVLTGDNTFSLAPYLAVKAVKSDEVLPPNPEAQQALQTAVDALQNPKPLDVPPMPLVADQVSGIMYSLSDNSEKWTAIGLICAGNQATLVLEIDGRRLEIPVGLDGVYRVSQVGLPVLPGWRALDDVPLAAKGGWSRNDRFAVSLRDLMGMQELELNLNFKDGFNVSVIENYAIAAGVPYKLYMTGTPH